MKLLCQLFYNLAFSILSKCYSKQCFSRVVSQSCFGKIPHKTQKTWQKCSYVPIILLCDASCNFNHGDHNCIQLMNRNSPERSVVSFCGLDGNEKFSTIIVKSIVPVIRRGKHLQEYS